MIACVFPGQGTQFPTMGKELYEQYPLARDYFQQADDILGYALSKTMFEGTAEDLKQTAITQPAVFLHSIISFLVLNTKAPQMVAGHSLGEFTALVACGALSFSDALRLVRVRATAMQEACEQQVSTMAVVMGLDDKTIDAICHEIRDEVVVAANFNCPNQVVISGTIDGVSLATEMLKSAGARRILPLNVHGAFHSPLMQPVQIKLQEAIENVTFQDPKCPIYQNVDAQPHTNLTEIKNNLLIQLTSPVLWTQTIQNMIGRGADTFVEYGPGDVLKGLIRKINSQVNIE